MQRGYVVRGRLLGRRIDLDESMDELDGEVELFVKPLSESTHVAPDILEVIQGLPLGTLTKEDVDARMQSVRAGWDDRG
jgi:hypothetical protein